MSVLFTMPLMASPSLKMFEMETKNPLFSFYMNASLKLHETTVRFQNPLKMLKVIDCK